MGVQSVPPGAKGVGSTPASAPVSPPASGSVSAPAVPASEAGESTFKASAHAGQHEAPAANEAQLRQELMEALAEVGNGFPEIQDGKAYLIHPEGGHFVVPFSEACQRAAQHGLPLSPQFVKGELVVQLGLQRYGNQLPDAVSRRNPALELTLQLLETGYAVRCMASRHPELANVAQRYAKTTAEQLNKQLSKGGAPPVLRALVSHFSGSQEGLSASELKAPQQELLNKAGEIFQALSTPPEVDSLKQMEGDRTEADRVARERVHLAKDQLWPSVAELLASALAEEPKAAPKPAAAAPDPSKPTGPQAPASTQPRPAQQRKIDEAAGQAFQALISEPSVRRWAIDRNPSPSGVLNELQKLVDRRRLDRDVLSDAVLEQVLRRLELRSKPQDPFHVVDSAQPAERRTRADAGSLYYPVTQKELPYVAELWSDAAALRPVVSTRPPETFGRGSLNYSQSPKEVEETHQDWVNKAFERFETVRRWDETFETLAQAEGATSEVAQRLLGLRATMASSMDQLERKLNQLRKLKQPVERNKVIQEMITIEYQFDSALKRHTRLLALCLGSDALQQARSKKLLGGNKYDPWELLRRGVQGVHQEQRPARERLEHLFKSYPSETQELRDLLTPRLERVERMGSLPAKSESMRGADPLLRSFDSLWLPEFAAELTRVERFADRLTSLAQQLPPTFPQREDLLRELSATGNLKGLLLKEASERLSERLAGPKEKPSASGPAVAAFHSRELPVMARFPRLHNLALRARLFQTEEGSKEDLEDLLKPMKGLSWLGHKTPDPEAADELMQQEAEQGRADFLFWCRTFDLDAPAQTFLAEFNGWSSGFSSALTPYSRIEGVDASTDPLGAALLSLLETAEGEHPHSSPSSSSSITRLNTLGSTLDTAASSAELLPFLDLETQPQDVLLRASKEALKAKDRATLVPAFEPWLTSPSRALRASAREALAKLQRVSQAQLWTEQIEGDASEEASEEQLLALVDLPTAARTMDRVNAVALALQDARPLVRLTAVTAAGTLASPTQGEAMQIIPLLAERLGDEDIHVVRRALDELQHLALGGSSLAADALIQAAQRGLKAGGQELDLALRQIAASPKSSQTVVSQAVQALEARKADAAREERLLPRPLPVPRETVARAQTGSVVELVLGSLQAPTGVLANTREAVESVSDRVKLALRLTGKFEEWVARQDPKNMGPSLSQLPIADAILEDAVADIAGQQPQGFLANASPEVLEALQKDATFSPVELQLLRTGQLPPALQVAAQHSLARQGRWEHTDLASLRQQPEDFQALLTLKRWLSPHTDDLCGELVATLLTPGLPPETSNAVKAQLFDLGGLQLDALDATLSLEERRALLSEVKKSALGLTSLEPVVVRHWLSLDADSDEAQLLLSYLQAGTASEARLSLSRALEQAPAGPHLDQLMNEIRPLAQQLRSEQSSVSARLSGETSQSGAAESWVFQLLTDNSQISTEQLLGVRDALVATLALGGNIGKRKAFEPAFTDLSKRVLRFSPDLEPEALSTVAALLTDRQSGRAANVTLDGLRQLFDGKVLHSELLEGLREAYNTVEGSVRYGEPGDELRRLGQMLDKAFTAKQDLSEREVTRLGELLAAATSESDKDSLAEGLGKLYRNQGKNVSAEVLEHLAQWLFDPKLKVGYSHGRNGVEMTLSWTTDLMPVDPPVLSVIARATAEFQPDEKARFINALKVHKRGSALTADTVASIAEKEMGKESKSRFSLTRKLLGEKNAASSWRPSTLSRFEDVTQVRYSDSEYLRTAKNRMRDGIMDALAGITVQHVKTFRSSEPLVLGGSFSMDRFKGATQDGPLEFQDHGNVTSIFDLSAEAKAARERQAQYRQAHLDGLRPYARDAAISAPSNRALAALINNQFAPPDPDDLEDMEPADSGQLNIQRYVEFDLNRRALKESAGEEGGGGNVSMSGLFDSPAADLSKRERSNRRLKINVFVKVDCSGSMQEDNRIAYAKMMATRLLETCRMIDQADVQISLIRFGQGAQTLLELNTHHDEAVLASAVESLAATDSTTNDAAATDLGAQRNLANPADITVDFTLTDGRGASSQAGKLKQYSHEQGIFFAGMGVGADAKFVESTYPYAITDNDPQVIDKKLFNFFQHVLAEGLKRERN